MKNKKLNNDYQYFCVLTSGGYLIDSLPMLVLPGSYVYMHGSKFYVAEYCETKPDGFTDKGDYDLCLYCEEVPNDIDVLSIIKQVKRNTRLDKILSTKSGVNLTGKIKGIELS